MPANRDKQSQHANGGFVNHQSLNYQSNHQQWSYQPLRRVFFCSVLLLTLAGLACSPNTGTQGDPTTDRHHKALVFDTHIDTPQRLLNEGTDYDMSQPDPLGHIDIPRMREGGLDAAFFSIWVDHEKYKEGKGAAQRALRLISSVYEEVDRHSEDLTLARTAADVRRAHRDGKIALLMGLEGGHPIEDDLRLLHTYALLGVRYMTLTHMINNNWGDSSTDENGPAHNGLTDFGKEVVREMNKLGIVVDISHVSDKTFFDAMEVTQAPVIASHSSCRALVDLPRNMTDDQIRAVAKNGGVVQVAFGSWFVSQPFLDATNKKEFLDWENANYARIKKECAGNAKCTSIKEFEFYQEFEKKAPRGTLKDIVDHIEHVIQVAGIDHVGYGSDYDGVRSMPEGMEDVTKLPQLTQKLVDRGYSDEDIQKILGGNTLRVLEEVEKIAAQLQQQ